MTDKTTATVPHAFADLIGMEITGRGEGSCTSAITISQAHMNPHQVAHGAVVYALADTGMGGALTSALNDDEICSTIEIKINYFRPALPGRVTCESRIIHKGKRTAALESEVTDEKGKLLARATGTFMILARP